MADEDDNPTVYKHPRIVSGKEIWESPQPSDQMTWAVCEYVRRWGDTVNRRKHCPTFRVDELHGEVVDGCRVWAEEACRAIAAVQRREAANG